MRRFRSPEKLKEFIDENSEKLKHVEINYYIQRTSQYYEKIIERTKRIVSQTILGHYTLMI